METTEKDRLFSVVMPVYNSEPYLEEAIESVLSQSVGFEENIQLILVDNASDDGSSEICRRYAARSPKNILCIRLEQNRGPGGARNAGIPYIRGKYVNFMDSDDRWDRDAFERVRAFMDGQGESVPAAACRMQFFDGSEDYHALDFRFNQDRVTDIRERYGDIQLHVTSAFIRREAIGERRFDESVYNSEDVLFLTPILLESGKYALLRSARYRYRKRGNGSSLSQTVGKGWNYYSQVLDKVFMALAEYSEAHFGAVLPYVQCLILYMLFWRLREDLKYSLSPEEAALYRDKLKELLGQIEDGVLLSAEGFEGAYKLYALRLKHGTEAVRPGEKGVCFENEAVYRADDPELLEIKILETEASGLRLEGLVSLPPDVGPWRFEVRDKAGKRYFPKLADLCPDNNICFLTDTILHRKTFTVILPLEDGAEYGFFLSVGEFLWELKPRFGEWSKLSNRYAYAHYACGAWFVTHSGGRLTVRQAARRMKARYERGLRRELLAGREYKALFTRLLLPILRRLKGKRQIWLITDRILSAGDNGEAFFRYAASREQGKRRVYFGISRDTEDYRRLKQYGRVAAYRSLKYKFLFLLSDRVISSVTNEWAIDSTAYIREAVKDWYRFKFVHLQHGVIKDDMSRSMNKYMKNIRLMTTTAQRERESILALPYGYGEREVALTGLARFDLVSDAGPGKLILLAPTWRGYLTGPWDWKRDTYLYSSRFKDSGFYRFYDKLLHDQRLLKALEENGFQAQLRLHPMMKAQERDFAGGPFQVQTGPLSYAEGMAQTALVVTDYSSTAFDHAYFGHPVIYTQFDREEFYRYHTYKPGYFSYERDGFGPVCLSYEDTVSAIVGAIERGCVMEEKYRSRADSFFAFRDRDNCRRIFDAVLTLDSEP